MPWQVSMYKNNLLIRIQDEAYSSCLCCLFLMISFKCCDTKAWPKNIMLKKSCCLANSTFWWGCDGNVAPVFIFWFFCQWFCDLLLIFPFWLKTYSSSKGLVKKHLFFRQFNFLMRLRSKCCSCIYLLIFLSVFLRFVSFFFFCLKTYSSSKDLVKKHHFEKIMFFSQFNFLMRLRSKCCSCIYLLMFLSAVLWFFFFFFSFCLKTYSSSKDLLRGDPERPERERERRLDPERARLRLNRFFCYVKKEK